METNRVLTDNELIAQFMGWKNRIFQVYADKPEEPIWFRPGEDFPSYYKTVGELEFESSWDWLMPVMEKIETLGYDTGVCGIVINGEKLTEVLISPQIKNNKIEVHFRTDEDKLLCTFKAIVYFIKCYSETQERGEKV